MLASHLSLRIQQSPPRSPYEAPLVVLHRRQSALRAEWCEANVTGPARTCSTGREPGARGLSGSRKQRYLLSSRTTAQTYSADRLAKIEGRPVARKPPPPLML